MGIDVSDKATMKSRHFARNRNISIALMTTVVARMSGVLLQVVSLPIAAIQLGAARYIRTKKPVFGLETPILRKPDA